MNFSPLKTALLDFLNNYNGRANVLGYWELDEVQEVQTFYNDDNGVHCTIMETSIMLYLFPELVDMSKGFDEYRVAKYMLGKDEIKEISNSGIIAQTTNSSKDKGKAYFEASVNGIIRLAKMFEDDSIF